jgi:hypothetical protein
MSTRPLHDSSLSSHGDYLALGDSMSIDKYTGVQGGGAVSQFHRRLGPNWELVDRTFDGCTMNEIPLDAKGNLITLTVSGNDAILHMDRVETEGVSFLIKRHQELLQSIRQMNPNACLIVGNVYAPQFPLSPELTSLLDQLNDGIARNVQGVGAFLADIRGAFAGREDEHLCLEIEPTLSGAGAIAELFAACFECWRSPQRLSNA